MSREKIAMGINLRQNKIVGSSAYGKYYPEVDQQKTLSLRGFAKHMTDHGSLYGRAIVEGVLMIDCRWEADRRSLGRRSGIVAD